VSFLTFLLICRLTINNELSTKQCNSFAKTLNNVIDVIVNQHPKLCIKVIHYQLKFSRIYTNEGWKNTRTNTMLDLRCKGGYATRTRIWGRTKRTIVLSLKL